MTLPSPSRYPALALAAALTAGNAAAAEAPEVARARYLWSQSPHGAFLERILPRAVEPHQLPEPRSEGAGLATRYCVQCHYLPSPQMHTAAKWKPIVERMYLRMKGHGNMGALMKDMMDRVEAPSDRDLAVLTRYLQRHGMSEIDPKHYPSLETSAGKMFTFACNQCHALPDPRRHTAGDWPKVVERMKRHMAWANVVVGVSALRTTPVLETEEIIRFLQRHARSEPRAK